MQSVIHKPLHTQDQLFTTALSRVPSADWAMIGHHCTAVPPPPVHCLSWQHCTMQQGDYYSCLLGVFFLYVGRGGWR